MTATTPFIAVVTAGRSSRGTGRSTVMVSEVSRRVRSPRGSSAYQPSTPADSFAPGAGSCVNSIRRGSSNAIRSRKVNE